MAAVALMGGWFGYDPRLLTQPGWFTDTTEIAGANIPNSRLLILGVAVLRLVGLMLLLSRTRPGLISRPGGANADRVHALGIHGDGRCTIVLAAGGCAA